MIGTYRMVRGDRRRLPSWDATEFIQLDTLDNQDTDATDVPDLTNRTVDLSLVTKARGGDKINLTNAVEIGDPTAGEVAIILEESDTAVPIDGSKTNLYGEFRISGGTNDPTTAGVIKIELYPSRHNIEGEAQLLPYADDFGAFAIDGVMDAAGASIQNVDDFGGTSATVDSVAAGQTTTGVHTSDSDRSVAGYTGQHFYDTVVDDDGTFYGIWHDPNDTVWDGGSASNDFVLESTTDPTDPDSWTEVYRWTGYANRAKVALHITASGTMLTGFGGSLWRSTDGGQSWTDVGAPTTDANTSIWSFTENATGSILASEHNAVRILESTDDGAMWTEFANTNDFPTFDTHIHKVKYHPVNDWIIATGGDSLAYRGFYRSTDGGTTWQHHRRNETYVAIAPHPTNGNVYFLGSDEHENSGIYRVHDDGTTIETKLVQTLDHRADPDTISGAFALAAYTTTVDGDDGFLAASTVENHPRLLLRSKDMSAVKWHAVGEVGPDPMGTSPDYDGVVGAMGTTTSRGPYEQVVDCVGLNAIVHGDQYMRVQTARDPMYGTAINNPLELRRTMGNIVFGDPNHQLFEKVIDGDSVHRMWQMDAANVDGRHTLVVRYNKSRVEFYSGTDQNNRLNVNFDTPAVDAFADVRLREDNQGNIPGLAFESREDLRGFTSWTDEIRVHDGSGTGNPAGPAWYNEVTGDVISLVDGSTIV